MVTEKKIIFRRCMLKFSSEVKWKSLSRVRLFVSPWNSPGQNTGVGEPFPFPGDLPNPGIEPRSRSLQVDSLPAEPHEKPKNTGVGSLSPLQGIFPTQESNHGLLHCRQILYPTELSGKPWYQGSFQGWNIMKPGIYNFYNFILGKKDRTKRQNNNDKIVIVESR